MHLVEGNIDRELCYLHCDSPLTVLPDTFVPMYHCAPFLHGTIDYLRPEELASVSRASHRFSFSPDQKHFHFSFCITVKKRAVAGSPRNRGELGQPFRETLGNSVGNSVGTRWVRVRLGRWVGGNGGWAWERESLLKKNNISFSALSLWSVSFYPLIGY